MDLGERINDYCIDHELDFREFAAAVGLTWIGLQRILNGYKLPNVVALKNMASVMGVRPEELLDDGSEENGDMTNSVALKELMALRDGIDTEEPEGAASYKAVQKGIDALKKQVSIKAKYNTDIGTTECPVCGSVTSIDQKRVHYCFNCGQAFNWSVLV